MIEPGTAYTFVRGPRHREVRLQTPLVYEDDRLYLRLPTGFCGDGASVPSPLWGIIARVTPLDICEQSLCHDYAYRVGAAARIDGQWRDDLTRVEADVIYRGILLATGIRQSTVDAIYYGVRAGGSSSWHRRPVL